MIEADRDDEVEDEEEKKEEYSVFDPVEDNTPINLDELRISMPVLPNEF